MTIINRNRIPAILNALIKSSPICASIRFLSVINPVLASLLSGPDTPENNAASTYFHVERTYSEFTLSAYAKEATPTNIPGVEIASSCQDCHMPPVEGRSTIISSTPTYDDLALHSLAGGNTWISGILASTDPSYGGYDEYNYEILSGEKYPGATIQVSGLENKGEAISSVAERATELLQNAVSIEVVESSDDEVVLRIHNNGGHKLLSGYPEGRRMFLNIQYLDGDGTLLDEVNPYEKLSTVLDSEGNAVYVSGGDLTVTNEGLVWEAKMTSPELTGEETSFHMALSTGRYKDNRIPPIGFNTDEMDVRLVQPRWKGGDAPDYFTEEEYQGGFDQVTLTPPEEAVHIEVTMYYQTTSKAYIEFLRDEVNGDNPTLPEEAYIAQTDPFFDELKGWGNAIWDLWLHNDGANPVEMASVDIEFKVETPEPEPNPDPLPEPEPEPEPQPEPETGGSTGIPGYPLETIILGLVLFFFNGIQSYRDLTTISVN